MTAPLVPVIVRVELPAGVLADVVIVTVELPEELMDAGENVAAPPAGRPLALRVTELANPLRAPTFSV